MTLIFNKGQFEADFSQKIMLAKNPRSILLAGGRAVTRTLKDHFLKKNRTERNNLGGKRQKFWDQIARSVNQPEIETPNSVSVTISDPRFAQKLFGGPIRAKKAKALTIPVTKEAYGRTATSFENETGLKLFMVRTGKSAFQNAVLAVKDKKGKGFTVEFVLTKEVNQEADPDALPSRSALEEAVLAKCQEQLDKEIKESEI